MPNDKVNGLFIGIMHNTSSRSILSVEYLSTQHFIIYPDYNYYNNIKTANTHGMRRKKRLQYLCCYNKLSF